MRVIGITGASGAGKTTVCSILKEKYEAYIIDADQIARTLSKKGSRYLQAIVEYFGEEILDEYGELKRKDLARIIYNNEEKRKGLNSITFIYVVEEIKEKIRKLEDEKVIVIDAPLLFESNLDQICDVVIGVVAKDTHKIERICKRDEITSQMAKQRLAIQVTAEELKKRANYIIENNEDIASLEQEVEKILYNIRKDIKN